MKHRRVVANYIFVSTPTLTNPPSSQPPSRSPPTPPPSPSRLLLFRRSHHPNIHSYRGLLAPISGSIDDSDASPLAAAVRELHEETGLVAGEDLRLEMVGQKFGFVDESAGRSWEVFPFGWRLFEKEDREGEWWEGRVRLDWEHEGFEVVDPREVLSDGALRARCVPRVEESLRRVWLGGEDGVFGGEEDMRDGNQVGEVFTSGMRNLRDDKENGARVLATNALGCLRDMAMAMHQDQADDRREKAKLWRMFRIAGWHLVHSARPSMNAAIGTAVCEALLAIRPLILDESTATNTITAELDKCIESRRTAAQRLATVFSDCAKDLANAADTINIVTLSSSSTIRAALLDLFNSSSFIRINMSILESRPRCEGASLAASLLSGVQATDNLSTSPSPSAAQPRPKVSITILPDSHLPALFTQFAATSSSPRPTRALVLLGADRVSPHGAVLNKTLSLSAAVLARTLAAGAAKVVVLAETDKLGPVSNLKLYKSEPERSKEREMTAHGGETGDAEKVVGAWVAAGVSEEDVGRLRNAIEQERGNEKGEGGGSRVEVDVRNETFEWVAPEWIDLYITEKGLLEREEIGEICVRRTQIEEEVFRDLYG